MNRKHLLLLLAALLVIGVRFPAFAAVEDTGFSDVDADAWYAEAVAYCQEQGLMSGTAATTFEPDGTLTRAMLVSILYRNAGSPAVTGSDTFRDTVPGAYYADAVLWASQQGVVSGYDNGLFGTDDPVSREQMTAILWRCAGSPAALESTAIRDRAEVTPYAAAAVDWASANQIVQPVSDGIFDPKSNATRAQAAAALMQYDRTTAPGQPSRILIAYFSRYGNTDYGADVDASTSASVVVRDGQRQGTTESIARRIAEQTGGDLRLIETASAYPADFNEVVDRNHQEAAGGVRPALASRVDASAYDTIFVGYPVWASTVPAPVLSFLEGLELSDKTVIPFCTHDGYGAGRSESAIREASGGATVKTGLAIDSTEAGSAEQTVADWLDGLQLPAVSRASGRYAIRVTIGDREAEGFLYDNGMARQFLAQLPQTIVMSNYGGREVYGSVEQPIDVEGEGQLRFDDGDITYCPANQTVAIFYSQSSRPDLTMTVYPIGKVTSDLSIFPALPSRVETVFETIA